eukprot:1137805-Pelagomonas_calceolata.AAC.1
MMPPTIRFSCVVCLTGVQHTLCRMGGCSNCPQQPGQATQCLTTGYLVCNWQAAECATAIQPLLGATTGYLGCIGQATECATAT